MGWTLRIFGERSGPRRCSVPIDQDLSQRVHGTFQARHALPQVRNITVQVPEECENGDAYPSRDPIRDFHGIPHSGAP